MERACSRPTAWWLVLGWVTTKEYHPCIRFRNDTLHVNIDFFIIYYIYIYIYICFYYIYINWIQ